MTVAEGSGRTNGAEARAQAEGGQGVTAMAQDPKSATETAHRP